MIITQEEALKDLEEKLRILTYTEEKLDNGLTKLYKIRQDVEEVKNNILSAKVCAEISPDSFADTYMEAVDIYKQIKPVTEATKESFNDI